MAVRRPSRPSSSFIGQVALTDCEPPSIVDGQRTDRDRRDRASGQIGMPLPPHLRRSLRPSRGISALPLSLRLSVAA